MTHAEHDAQRAMVIASEMLALTRADRHGTYANRRKALPAVVPVPVATAPMHVFVLPIVTEWPL